MKIPAIALAGAALAAPALFVLAVLAGAPAGAQIVPGSDQAVASKAAALLHDPHSQVLGNPNGDVTIVEFFDYACPVCKAIEPKLEDLLKTDKGVKLVIKEFPILTPESLVATKVAFAADKQGKYAPFHQALMLYRGPLTEAVIYDTAKRVGLNEKRMRKDMASAQITEAVYTNLNLARSLRMNTTPGLIIGNHINTMPSVEVDFPKAVAAVRESRG